MARLQLSPTNISPSGFNVTTALAALGANTGVQWSNTGREILVAFFR